MKLNLPKQRNFKGPARIWKRALAFLIDITIIDFLLGVPFRSLFLKVVPEEDFFGEMKILQSSEKALMLLTVIMISYMFLYLLYFAILEYKLGTTIGKMFMRIKVEEDKNAYGFLSYIIRNMVFIFIFPFILLWIADPLFMLFNRDGRRLSEILSRTRTVEDYIV